MVSFLRKSQQYAKSNHRGFSHDLNKQPVFISQIKNHANATIDVPKTMPTQCNQRRPLSKRSRISCSLEVVSKAPNPDEGPYAELLLVADLETPRSKSLVLASNVLPRPELIPYRLLLLPVERDAPSPEPRPCP